MRNLRNEIAKKTNNLKTKIKELHNLFNGLYNIERNNNNARILAVRKNYNKVVKAYQKVSEVEAPKEVVLEEEKNLKISKSMEDLKISTLKNLKILEEYYTQKEIEARRNKYSYDLNVLRKNIDNLHLAYNDIKRLDNGLGLTKRDWENIENRF